MALKQLVDLIEVTEIGDEDLLLVRQAGKDRKVKGDVIFGGKDGLRSLAGWTDALLDAGGITPNGLPDTAIASQRLDALKVVAQDAARDQSLIAAANIAPERKKQRYSTEEIASLALTAGEPAIIINSGASLSFVELITPVTDYDNVLVFFEFDYINGTEGVDFTFNGTSMDDLNRTNPGTINGITATRISDTKYQLTISTTAAEKAFAGWSVRAIVGQACSFKIKRVSVVESGVLNGTTDFSLLAKRDAWTSSIAEHSSTTTRQRIQIPDGHGATLNCDHCHITSMGSSEFGKPPYNISYYLSTLSQSGNTTKTARMQAGVYRPVQTRYYIQPTTDVNLVAVGGKVEIMCGKELPTSTWTTHQAGPTVFVRRAPYNPSNHWNANVRNNTVQPRVAAMVVDDGRTRSVLNYAFTPASSIAEVEASNGRTFFDGTNMYFSFPNSSGNEDSCYVYVCETDVGIRYPSGATPVNLNAFNIHVTASEVYNWRFRPDALGSKFLSLHNCGSYANATKEGYSIDRINSELINCRAESNRLDDFNFHDGGYSLLINPYSRSAGDDGISHHETCEGWVENATIKFPAAAFSIPAFGAKVGHRGCVGYASTSGTNSNKSYTGSFAVLSGIGADSVSRASYAYYEGCKTVNSTTDYYAVSQDSKNARIDVSNPSNSTGSIVTAEGGVSTTINLKT